MSWLNIADLSDIPLRGARRLKVGQQQIAVFRTADNQVYALADQCPHKQGPLSQGIIHDACVTCPLHNWVISLKDGTAQGADQGQVRTYETRVEGTRIWVHIGVSLVQAA